VAAVIALLIARMVPGTGSRPQAAGAATIDIKGALALSATITSFLVGLTFIENASAYDNSLQVIAASFAASAASLAGFVLIERRVQQQRQQPLVNLRLLRHRVLLPTYLMMILVGTTMFLAYPTVVQLVRSPSPSGFGGDALEAAHVQLPFMVIFLIFSSVSAFIISRLGKVNPTVFGGAISIIGAVGLAMFHSTGLVVSANLAVIAVGLAMTATANWNLVVSSAPVEFTGISTGIGALLFAIGMAIGPALAGTYMQTYTVTVGGTPFPAPESFTMIFLTSALLSAASLAFSLVLKKRMPRAAEEMASPS
jgi:hypothetical protein